MHSQQCISATKTSIFDQINVLYRLSKFRRLVVEFNQKSRKQLNWLPIAKNFNDQKKYMKEKGMRALTTICYEIPFILMSEKEITKATKNACLVY